jgi:hypothetical protein
MKPNRSKPRGRSGGRAGGSGYDFQDLYVACQLAKLLVGDRDPPVEVLWEKNALDRGQQLGATHVDVNDTILHLTSGKWIYVQVKETAPAEGWSAHRLVQTGVARQFWHEWKSKTNDEQLRTFLRLASCGDVTPLAMVADVALRSRTPDELLSDEAAVDIADDIKTLANEIGLSADNPDFLAFLKCLQAEQLRVAGDLESLIIQSLAVFGERAPDLAQRLIRLVTRSKHIGEMARSAFTKETLVQELRWGAFPDDSLIAAGVLRAEVIKDPNFWDSYRDQVVKRFRSFRLYGLQVDRIIYADLPTLFLPPKLNAIPAGTSDGSASSSPDSRTLTLSEKLRIEGDIVSREDSEELDDRASNEDTLELAKAFTEKRRFALISGAGTGKTITLKWLAVILALRGAEGQRERLKNGLSEEEMIPVYLRFRQFAERIRTRGLIGVEGRAGLVADLLAAEFEAGVAGRILTRSAALQMAQELLESDKTILLFDGLDEVVDDTMRNRLFDAVADLLKTYRAPRVVVSSRPYAFRRDRAPLELSLFELLPLGRAARGLFARQWYQAIRTNLGEPTIAETDASARAEDLARAANALPDLSENPLLLSILALVHFNRQGLPLEKATLYDHATLAMLGHWDRDPAGRDLGDDAIPADWAGRLSLGEREIRPIVEHLAYRIQVQSEGGEFSRDVALAGLNEGIASFHKGAASDKAERSSLLLKLLTDRAGLLQERSPGVFAFVHLSFQEYLAARWFVGRGMAGLEEIARLAGEERHAEVLRFVAAVLSAEQSSENDQRAAWLIETVQGKSPIVAAACCIEMPRLRIGDKTAAKLAREVYSASTGHRNTYLPARVTARLFWAVLGPTDWSDHVLLEILSEPHDPHDERMFMRDFERRKFDEKEYRMFRRHFRDFEEGSPTGAILALRPPHKMAAPLAWVLQRLTVWNELNYPDMPPAWLGRLAALLLVEAGEQPTKSHIQALVDLLSDSEIGGGFYDLRDSLSTRAEQALKILWEDQMTKAAVREVLEGTISRHVLGEGRSRHVVWAAARFMFNLGETSAPWLAEALVAGFSARSRHTEVSGYLQALASSPDKREPVIGALEKGLTDEDEDVRIGSARTLIDFGMIVPGTSAALSDDEDFHLSRFKQLLTDPSTSTETVAVLAEDIWGEEHSAAWRAALLLIGSGHSAVPGVAHALVNSGLCSASHKPEAMKTLRQFYLDPQLNLATRGVLLNGLSSTDDAVAAASALLLFEFEGPRSPSRLKRLVKASLRDPNLVADVEPYLKRLLLDPSWTQVLLDALGNYLGDKPNRLAVCLLGRMLAEANYFATRNLVDQLIQNGLSQSQDYEEVLGYLKRILDNPELVTSTRRALLKGLESNSEKVAWGSARCLWETGSRLDSTLATALARVGLGSSTYREQARAWLLELLSHPRTARIARKALEGTMYSSLHPPSNRSREYALAWNAAGCLAAAGILRAEGLVEALVVGGLGMRESHRDTMPTIRQMLAKDGELAAEVSEALWKALDDENEAIQWGAALILTESDHTLQDVTTDDSDSDADDEDTDEEDEGTKTLARLWRILIRKAPEERQAAEWLAKLINTSSADARRRRTLVKLLADKDEAIAYAAARCLIALKETKSPDLARTLIEHGLTNTQRSDEATRLLNELHHQPAAAWWVTEALNRALWGTDEDAAWAAALYMWEHDNSDNFGIPRALVFGGLGSWHWKEAEERLRRIAAEANLKSPTIDALAAALDIKGERKLRSARLLVEVGAPMNDQVVATLAEWARWQPEGPLALLAVTNRRLEAREVAQRTSLQKFVDLLGSELVAGAWSSTVPDMST